MIIKGYEYGYTHRTLISILVSIIEGANVDDSIFSINTNLSFFDSSTRECTVIASRC